MFRERLAKKMHDIFLILDLRYEPDLVKIAKVIAKISENGEFWSDFPGCFAFRTDLDHRTFEDELKKSAKGFIAFPFDPRKVIGKQNDWDTWNLRVFPKYLRDTILFNMSFKEDLSNEELFKLLEKKED